MSDSKPLTPDQAAAHQFLCELRTRITTQPLPFQFGVETRALESLWEVFGQAREAMKDNPGCDDFAARVSKMLNEDLRPLTAKWHRAQEEGRLKSQDGAQEFRSDLRKIQGRLNEFADELHQLAYGRARAPENPPRALDAEVLDRYFAPLEFGIPINVRVEEGERTEINSAEAGEIEARRIKAGVGAIQGKDAIGLALSGGGIRSATFCLGVVQVLAQTKFLREIDFLSTVSGGGYTGCLITRRLGDGAAQTEMAAPHGPDPAPIRHARLNAKYLAARNLKRAWSMATATLAGMLLNWTVPLLIIIVAAIVAVGLPRFGLWKTEWWKVAFGISGLLTVAALYGYGAVMRCNPRKSAMSGVILAVMLGVTVLIGAGWTLSAGYPAVPNAIDGWWKRRGGIDLSLAALIAVGPSLIRFLPVLKNPLVRKIVLRVLLMLAGLIIPLLGILVFYTFWSVGDLSIKPDWSAWHPLRTMDGLSLLVCVVALLGLLDFFLLNINLTAPHRLYRDALARTFIAKDESDTRAVDLATVNPQQAAPYHLINAALNIPSTDHPAVRDRLCDFFFFSKRFTGSPATGYHKTNAWKANGRPVDLATAMAVSGAAFSSYMGLGSMPTLTALLTFLNVRLGFWIRQPSKKGSPHPGFLCLLREMFGIAMSEKRAWLNLSDGGHLENLAIYELLRRRCKFIIAVDGEADPTFAFAGFMTLIRHAQIDLGVRIGPRLDAVRPDPETGLSRSHTHFCRVHYPERDGMPAGTGLLLYIKLSVTGNETEVIKRYRVNHPEFPHQSTLDQFFDQEQFEAYRQLGVHVAERLLLDPFTVDENAVDQKAPARVRAWFRKLAENLLQPEDF